jgi:hypothetical protein
MTHTSAPTGRGHPDVKPRVELLPRPPIHADLPPLAALAATDENAAASSIEVALGQRECLADAQTGAPKHDDQRSGPQSVCRAARDAHDSDDLLNGWRSAGYRRPLLRGGRPQCKPGMVAGERRRPAASSKTESIMEPASASGVRCRDESATAGRRPPRQSLAGAPTLSVLPQGGSSGQLSRADFAALSVIVRLSSERARQGVRQDCFAKKQQSPPALLVVVQSRSA